MCRPHSGQIPIRNPDFVLSLLAAVPRRQEPHFVTRMRPVHQLDFDVLKQLRAKPETKELTIWMLSVLAEQSNKTKAQELGADDYIVKSSYTPQQIVAKVKEFLAK